MPDAAHPAPGPIIASGSAEGGEPHVEGDALLLHSRHGEGSARELQGAYTTTLRYHFMWVALWLLAYCCRGQNLKKSKSTCIANTLGILRLGA